MQIAVVWAAHTGFVPGIEYAQLPFETKYRPVYIGFAGEQAGVVDQIAGREIVRAVGYYFIRLQQLQGILAG